MGSSVSFPLPLRIAQKLPVRNSWESIIKKLPIPLPIFYFRWINWGSINEQTVSRDMKKYRCWASRSSIALAIAAASHRIVRRGLSQSEF